MKCVYYDDRLPNGFQEDFFFSKEMPYTISIKQFQTEDIVPLHYAETIEVLLCDHLCGEIVIDSHRFNLEGQQVFVIPPYTVHSNNIRSGPGTMYVFKLNIQEMNHYLNVSNYLASGGCTLSQLDYRCAEYDSVEKILRKLIAHDADLLTCLVFIMELFAVLARNADPSRSTTPVISQFREASLQELIRWTHENYARRISIDEVARLTGYSKFHFCSRFKALTGMTYLHYLNTVRVSKACRMLRSGDSVQTVSRSTGFENVSYFIQMFKRIQHMTPYQYASQIKKLDTE